jgi:hypothetical protein
MKWNEKYKAVVVSTSHLPYKLAEKMDNNAEWLECPFVWEKTNYGYRIWTRSDINTLPKKIRPIVLHAKNDGYRWIEFDCDGSEQEEFQTWEW